MPPFFRFFFSGAAGGRPGPAAAALQHRGELPRAAAALPRAAGRVGGSQTAKSARSCCWIFLMKKMGLNWWMKIDEKCGFEKS